MSPYEKFQVIPDQQGMGHRYRSARGATQTQAWFGVVITGGIFLISLFFFWGVVFITGTLALFVWAIWKARHPAEPVPLLCPQCHQGTVPVRRPGPGVGQRTVLFACHRCRIAVDSGIVEHGRFREPAEFPAASLFQPPPLPRVSLREPPPLGPPPLP